jgi:hypothetical protein
MAPPTITTVTPSGSSSILTISWVDPTNTGGSPITGYYVQINNGYGSAFVTPGTLVAFGTNTYTFTNLI